MPFTTLLPLYVFTKFSALNIICFGLIVIRLIVKAYQINE
jgi:hypothetical protein